MNKIVELTFDDKGQACVVVEAGKKWKAQGKDFMFFTVPRTRISIVNKDLTHPTDRRLRSGEVIWADPGCRYPLFEPRTKQIICETTEAMLILAKMAADALVESGKVNDLKDPEIRAMANWYAEMTPEEWQKRKVGLLGQGEVLPNKPPESTSGARLVYSC